MAGGHEQMVPFLILQRVLRQTRQLAPQLKKKVLSLQQKCCSLRCIGRNAETAVGGGDACGVHRRKQRRQRSRLVLSYLHHPFLPLLLVLVLLLALSLPPVYSAGTRTRTDLRRRRWQQKATGDHIDGDFGITDNDSDVQSCVARVVPKDHLSGGGIETCLHQVLLRRKFGLKITTYFDLNRRRQTLQGSTTAQKRSRNHHETKMTEPDPLPANSFVVTAGPAHGDVISVLPMLKFLSDDLLGGEPVHVCVHQKYADVLDGVSYARLVAPDLGERIYILEKSLRKKKSFDWVSDIHTLHDRYGYSDVVVARVSWGGLLKRQQKQTNNQTIMSTTWKHAGLGWLWERSTSTACSYEPSQIIHRGNHNSQSSFLAVVNKSTPLNATFQDSTSRHVSRPMSCPIPPLIIDRRNSSRECDFVKELAKGDLKLLLKEGRDGGLLSTAMSNSCSGNRDDQPVKGSNDWRRNRAPVMLVNFDGVSSPISDRNQDALEDGLRDLARRRGLALVFLDSRNTDRTRPFSPFLAPKLHDMLALFDAAQVLVSLDTSTAWLAEASPGLSLVFIRTHEHIALRRHDQIIASYWIMGDDVGQIEAMKGWLEPGGELDAQLSRHLKNAAPKPKHLDPAAVVEDQGNVDDRNVGDLSREWDSSILREGIYYGIIGVVIVGLLYLFTNRSRKSAKKRQE